jgi:hypothetical protein
LDFTVLDKSYTVELVSQLEHLEASVAELAAAVASSEDKSAICDGEFDAVCVEAEGRRRKYKQRMALLTLIAPASSVLFSFHLPSLFGAFEDKTSLHYAVAPEAHAGARALFSLLETTRLVTWCGTSSDLPALQCALPSLRRPLHFDLQREVINGLGRHYPVASPVSLHGAVLAHFDRGLNKAFQLANWAKPPTPELLAYAGGDVVVLSKLYERFNEGTLYKKQT